MLLNYSCSFISVFFYVNSIIITTFLLKKNTRIHKHKINDISGCHEKVNGFALGPSG